MSTKCQPKSIAEGNESTHPADPGCLPCQKPDGKDVGSKADLVHKDLRGDQALVVSSYGRAAGEMVSQPILLLCQTINVVLWPQS